MNCASAIAVVAPVTIKMLRVLYGGLDLPVPTVGASVGQLTANCLDLCSKHLLQQVPVTLQLVLVAMAQQGHVLRAAEPL